MASASGSVGFSARAARRLDFLNYDCSINDLKANVRFLLLLSMAWHDIRGYRVPLAVVQHFTTL
jgi:hypothetical protein